MSTTIYLQMNKSVQVNRSKVRLQDLAYVMCENKEIENKCKELSVLNLTGEQAGAYTMTALQLVKILKSEIPDIEINHIGEPGIVINYEPNPSKIRMGDYIKTAIICLIIFFGTGFSIMTFNTDVSTRELFSNLYQEVTGVPSSGFTEMELFYSIGIGIGAVFFFNHFSFKNKKKDPSALDIQMCLYEKDVETTVLDQESKGAGGT